MCNRGTFRGDREAINGAKVCPGPIFSPQVTPSPSKRARIFCLAQALSPVPCHTLWAGFLGPTVSIGNAYVDRCFSLDAWIHCGWWSVSTPVLVTAMTTAVPKYLSSPTATGFRLRISTCLPGTKLWVGFSDGIGRERETLAHTEFSLSIREIT